MAPSHEPNDQPSLTLYLSPRWVLLALACIVLMLEVAHVGTSILRYEFGHENLFGFVRQFNVDEEANLPTWYSASALLIAALLLGMIAAIKYRLGEPYVRHWFWLAIIFMYLSADEASRIHEMSEPFTQRLHFSGFVHYPWVIGGVLAVFIIGLSYLRFLLHLQRKLRPLFVVAAVLYVGGALGVESVCANIDFCMVLKTYDIAWWPALKNCVKCPAS